MYAQNGQREKTGSFPEAVINEHCTQKELLLHWWKKKNLKLKLKSSEKLK
jgi:hypothetical protein